MYNKKEFKEIASLINSLDKITVYILSAKKDTEITVRKDLLIDEFVALFKESNPKFDEDKFREACK